MFAIIHVTSYKKFIETPTNWVLIKIKRLRKKSGFAKTNFEDLISL
jgi:hypothetical protein